VNPSSLCVSNSDQPEYANLAARCRNSKYPRCSYRFCMTVENCQLINDGWLCRCFWSLRIHRLKLVLDSLRRSMIGGDLPASYRITLFGYVHEHDKRPSREGTRLPLTKVEILIKLLLELLGKLFGDGDGKLRELLQLLNKA